MLLDLDSLRYQMNYSQLSNAYSPLLPWNSLPSCVTTSFVMLQISIFYFRASLLMKVPLKRPSRADTFYTMIPYAHKRLLTVWERPSSKGPHFQRPDGNCQPFPSPTPDDAEPDVQNQKQIQTVESRRECNQRREEGVLESDLSARSQTPPSAALTLNLFV